MIMRKLVGAEVAVLLVAIATGWGQFYRGENGEEVPLNIDSLKVLLKFDERTPEQGRTALLESVDRIVAEVEDKMLLDGFTACTLSTGEDYNNFLDSLDTLDGVYLVEPYYLLAENDSSLLFGETFLVVFPGDVTQSEIDSINAMYNVVVGYSINGLPNFYILRNTDSSGYRILDLANAYYDLSETIVSHPNFRVRLQKAAYELYDYYHYCQRYIKYVIGEFNSASVWDFAGLDDTLTIAVIDDGVEAHEDLPAARVLPGYDFADGDSDPSPYAHAHGMAMAGIIAASHLTEYDPWEPRESGIISLDPHVKVLPVKIFSDFVEHHITDDSLALAVVYAFVDEGADVLNCSWGDPQLKNPWLKQVMDASQIWGREGRGVPVICAAGNHGGFPLNRPAAWDACFAVGAFNQDAYERWYYSAYDTGYGGNLDLVSPTSDICLYGDQWSFDRMGTNGYNDYLSVYLCYPYDPLAWDCPLGGGANDVNYNCKTGGTSMATAMVSGVASLILAKDPELFSSEVYEILRRSAVQIGYSPPNAEYGWGRVDAFRAILSISHGNVDNDAERQVNICDITYLVDYLLRSGPAPFPSPLLGDCDCNGDVNITDITYLIGYLFEGGDPPNNRCFKY